MDNYITLKEFYKKLNVSKAAAYKLINKEEYKHFVIKENGVIKINAALIDIIKGTTPPPTVNTTIKEETPKEENKDFINYLLEENKELKKTIAEKESIITELTKTITELTNKSQELIEKSLIITSQQQYLTAAQQQPKEKGFKRLFSRKKHSENTTENNEIY